MIRPLGTSAFSLLLIVSTLLPSACLYTGGSPRQCKMKMAKKRFVLRFPVKSCGRRGGKLPLGSLDPPGIRQSVRARRGDPVTAKQMMIMFPGLFLNEKTAKKVTQKLRKKPTTKRPGVGIPKKKEINQRPPPDHDGDIHCPSFRNLEKAPDIMNNIRNEVRDVVHFSKEGVHQYVHKGTCGPAGTQSCPNGACIQEKSIVYLMVWSDSPDLPTKFEPFEVESYCSCKGVTRG